MLKKQNKAISPIVNRQWSIIHWFPALLGWDKISIFSIAGSTP